MKHTQEQLALANEFIKKCHVLGVVHATEGGVMELNSLLCDFLQYANLAVEATNTTQIEVGVDNQEIINVLITALEGGSNYWYDLPDISMVRSVIFDKRYPLSEKIGKAVLEHGVVVPVYDAEEKESYLGDISEANIKRGLKLFLEKGHEWDEAMDAGDADTFFQCVVMGKIVFG